MRRGIAYAAALTLLLIVPDAPAAQSHGCMNTFGGDVISATNVGCKRARSVVRTWAHKYQDDGEVRQRARGFECRDSSNSVEGLVVRCTRGAKKVRFYANVAA